MSISARVLDGAIVAALGLYLILLVHIVSHESERQPVVDQIRLAVTLEHQIGALDVAMRIAPLMNILKRVQHLSDQAQCADFACQPIVGRLVQHLLQVGAVTIHYKKSVFFVVVVACAWWNVFGHGQMLQTFNPHKIFDFKDKINWGVFLFIERQNILSSSLAQLL